MRSGETFSLVKRWINDCCSHHVECRSSTNPTELPTRLICVYPVGTSSKIRANICRGNLLPKDTPYLTLSHCWGEIEFLTTTRATLSAYECSLPIDSLSRTFQDALLATLELGFLYLWIDSLCIVQDDPEDWKRESHSMYEIYRNASCNISASGFSDGQEGFILDERRIDPTLVDVSLARAATQNLFGDKHYLTCAFPWEEMREGPIFRRAWTLQEQLLVSSLMNGEINVVTILTGETYGTFR